MVIAFYCNFKRQTEKKHLRLFRWAVSVTQSVIALCGVFVSSVYQRKLRTTLCHRLVW